ncbi:uncharacterized protein BHQ10_008097 [Talaromyces amestolkiae]|uniref:Zn(2)-C6 fungal-type domain-containing protein n=1 Tax=Talaromyces amestolkiae TaxID=1196081 RepID=A0A364L8E4_TALAM|nr:uncharacterized protein BHQ10_008097 [Talaromyces amestolkiae]RAO72085.1 hypothetical protein BHQ10_008097 [Talaromyces amestolkiae]
MVSPLVTRRNGKTQACEPCRRRKVACDHGYPVCRRCLKRPNGESTCYYASPDQDARSAELTVSRQAVHDTSTLGSKSTAVSSQANRHVGPEDRIWSSPAARAPRGFFGPTSLSAAYLETESSLAARGPSPIVPASPTKPTAPSPADIQNMVNLDLSANNLAIRALQAIPEEPAMSLYRSHTNPNDEWMGRISERLVISTWETFGSYLRDRENVAKLHLDDTALLSDKETFQGQLHRIDADGWDMDGRFHSSSLLRVRMMVALIRDEILEVVLDQSGNNALDDILYEKPE